MRNVPFVIDHLNFAVADRAKAEGILMHLGFTRSGNNKDAFSHIFFNRGYIEVLPYNLMPSVQQQDCSDHLVCLYCGSSAVAATLPALKSAGYDMGDLEFYYRRARHSPTKTGMAYFACLTIPKAGILGDDKILGLVQHLTPQLLFAEDQYPHLNNARAISRAIFVCKDAAAEEQITLKLESLNETLAGTLDSEHTIETASLMTAEEYQSFFGVPYTGRRDFTLAALCFDNTDRVYVKEQLEDSDLRWSDHGDSLFVDLTDIFGFHFIFE